MKRGAVRRWVLESDIANCFEAIPHSGLMSAIEERIVDRQVLKLLRAMLRAGVMEDQAVTRSDAGTPQGGVISPCLCNVYLHRLDRQWAERGHGELVRFADDMVVMCRSRQEAERALGALRAILGGAGAHAQGRQDADRGVARRRGGAGLSRLPSPLGARQHARFEASDVPRPLALTAGDGSAPAVGSVSSRTVAGSATQSKMSCRTSTGSCAAGRGTSGTETPPSPSTRSRSTPLRAWPGFIAKRHKRRTRYGWGVSATHSPDRMGLIDLEWNHRRATALPVVAQGKLNADGEERRRAVCGRTACTDRGGGGRKPGQSGQHVPRSPGASRRPYRYLLVGALCSPDR